jgi:hypothetical protein
VVLYNGYNVCYLTTLTKVEHDSISSQYKKINLSEKREGFVSFIVQVYSRCYFLFKTLFGFILLICNDLQYLFFVE